MSKKSLFIILALGCLGVALYTASYFWVASSEGFAFVAQQIKSSGEIQAEVGAYRRWGQVFHYHIHNAILSKSWPDP
jgi:hypothetical protein